MHGPEPAALPAIADNDNRENLLLTVLAVCLIILGFFPSLVTGPLANTSEAIRRQAAVAPAPSQLIAMTTTMNANNNMPQGVTR